MEFQPFLSMSKIDIDAARSVFPKSENLLLILPVQNLMGRELSDHFVLACTEFEMYFVIPNRNRYTIEKSFRFIDLVSITPISIENKVTLEFVDIEPLTLITPLYKDILGFLAVHLQKLLPKQLIKQIGILDLTEKRISQDRDCCLLRTKAYCAKLNIDYDAKCVEAVNEIFLTKNPNLDLPDLGRFTIAFIYGLELQLNFESITLHKFIIKYIPELQNAKISIPHISFTFPITENIVKFISKNCVASSISFENSELDDINTATEVSKACTARVTTLGMHNAMNTSLETCPLYDSKFYIREFITQLYYLNLSNSKDINVKKIIKYVPNLTILNLENCNIQIPETLVIISQENMRNLRCINLSNNSYTKLIPNPSQFKLGQNFTRIDISKSLFYDDCLPNFFEFLVAQDLTYGLRLYCANLNCEYEDFEASINLLEKEKFNKIIELNWSGNVIQQKFLHVLKRNSSLTALFVDNCFSESSQYLFSNFVSILKSLRDIQILSIKDTTKQKIGYKIFNLLTALKYYSKLIALNLEGNTFKSEYLGEFLEFVSRTTNLKYLSFGSISTKKAADIITFYSDLTNLNKLQRINYPTAEINNFPETKAKLNEILETANNGIPNYSMIDFSVFPSTPPISKDLFPKGTSSPFEVFLFRPDKFVEKSYDNPEDEPRKDKASIEARKAFFLSTVSTKCNDDHKMRSGRGEYCKPDWTLPDFIGGSFDNKSAIHHLEYRYTIDSLGEI